MHVALVPLNAIATLATSVVVDTHTALLELDAQINPPPLPPADRLSPTTWVVQAIEVAEEALLVPGAQFVTLGGEDQTTLITSTRFFSGNIAGVHDSWGWFEVSPTGEITGTLRGADVELTLRLDPTANTIVIDKRERLMDAEGLPTVAAPRTPVDPTELVLVGCGNRRSRRSIPALRNTTVCEVFLDGDDSWFAQWGAAEGVTRMLQALAFSNALFVRDFGPAVTLQAAGSLHSVASPASGSAAADVLNAYSSWLARGVTSDTELAPDRPGGLPSGQLVCLNHLFTHTPILSSAELNAPFTIGLANVAQAPSYATGSCATSLLPRAECASSGLNCSAPNGSTFKATNTGFATTATPQGVLDSGTFHLTVAHEIAHTFSALHDDYLEHPEGLSGPGRTGCAVDGISLMLAEASHNSSTANFSLCSIRDINDFVTFRRNRGTCLTGPSPCDSTTCPAATVPCKIAGVCDHRDGSCYPEINATNGTPCDTVTQVGYCVSQGCVARPAGCGERLLLDVPGVLFDGLYTRSNLTFRSRAVYHYTEVAGQTNTALFFDMVIMTSGANVTSGWFLGPIDSVYRLPTTGVPWLFNSTAVAFVATDLPLDPSLFTPTDVQFGVTVTDISQCSLISAQLFCERLQVSGFSSGRAALNVVYTKTATPLEGRPVFHNPGSGGINLYFSRLASSWIFDTDLDSSAGIAAISVEGAPFSPAQLSDPVASGADSVSFACLDTPGPTPVPSATPTSTPSTAPSAVPTRIPTAPAPTALPSATPSAVPSLTPTAVPSAAPTSAAPTAAPTAPTEAPTNAPTFPPATLLRVTYSGDLRSLSASDVLLFATEVTNRVVTVAAGAINASHILHVNITAGSILATVVLDPTSGIDLATTSSVAAQMLEASDAVSLPASGGGSAPRTFAFTAVSSGLVSSAAPTPNPTFLPTSSSPPPPVTDGGATNSAMDSIDADTQDAIYYYGFGASFVAIVGFMAALSGVGCFTKKSKQKKKAKKKEKKVAKRRESFKRNGSILSPRASPEWDGRGERSGHGPNPPQYQGPPGFTAEDWRPRGAVTPPTPTHRAHDTNAVDTVTYDVAHDYGHDYRVPTDYNQQPVHHYYPDR